MAQETCPCWWLGDRNRGSLSFLSQSELVLFSLSFAGAEKLMFLTKYLVILLISKVKTREDRDVIGVIK